MITKSLSTIKENTLSLKKTVLNLVLGDKENMLRTLKDSPKLNTGDWYSKVIDWLEKEIKKEH